MMQPLCTTLCSVHLYTHIYIVLLLLLDNRIHSLLISGLDFIIKRHVYDDLIPGRMMEGGGCWMPSR